MLDKNVKLWDIDKNHIYNYLLSEINNKYDTVVVSTNDKDKTEICNFFKKHKYKVFVKENRIFGEYNAI